MHASTDTRPHRSPGAVGIPVQAGSSVVDAVAMCGCGQELTSRHQRCTRCGR